MTCAPFQRVAAADFAMRHSTGKKPPLFRRKIRAEGVKTPSYDQRPQFS
jgi:hypothetical protein